MIVEYYRPERLEDALALLNRTSPVTYPQGGGTYLNRPAPEAIAVVDLQALGLDQLQQTGSSLGVGATVTLETLCASKTLPPALEQATRLEATANLRHMATVAGTIVSADGRSPLLTALLALDISLEISYLKLGKVVDESLTLGNLLPLRKQNLKGRLITRLYLPLNACLVYEYVARSLQDLPVVCVALAVWPSGRTRLALGGFGAAPLLALDGPEASGAAQAAQAACHKAEDAWATAEYRRNVVVPLVQRCLDFVNQTSS